MSFIPAIDASLRNAFMLYVGMILALYVAKPRLLFDEVTKRPRSFGLGYNRDREKRTLFGLSTTIIPLAVLSWITVADF